MWLLVLLSALPRIGISIYPRVARAGSLVRLECRVSRHSANKQLDMGIVGWSTSSRTLEGEAAPVIYTQTLHVPCTDQITAFCLLTEAGGKTHLERATVQVWGCDGA